MTKPRRFHLAGDDEIKAGLVSDVYFRRAMASMDAAGLDAEVVMEVRAGSLPGGWPWAVLVGCDEVAALFDGVPVDVDACAEGSVFHPGDPVMVVTGSYRAFGELETALLGMLCQASGVATKAARCVAAAAGKPVFNFGARRMHPGLAPLIARSAYIGGCSGVATVAGAEALGIQPVGTIPHALILVCGDMTRALTLFDKAMPAEVSRVALVDTFCDEKIEALAAAEALGDRLFAVRLDTPSSRRGDMAQIVREVRWELDLRGHGKVGIIASGGLDEASIAELADLCDGFGVGTCISNAPTVNFAMDIVVVDGAPLAKRGKWSGRKSLWRCSECLSSQVLPRGERPRPCPCGGAVEEALVPLVRKGSPVAESEPPADIRSRVLAAVGAVAGPEPA